MTSTSNWHCVITHLKPCNKWLCYIVLVSSSMLVLGILRDLISHIYNSHLVHTIWRSNPLARWKRIDTTRKQCPISQNMSESRRDKWQKFDRRLTNFCHFGQITANLDIFCLLFVTLDNFLSIILSFITSWFGHVSINSTTVSL